MLLVKRTSIEGRHPRTSRAEPHHAGADELVPPLPCRVSVPTPVQSARRHAACGEPGEDFARIAGLSILDCDMSSLAMNLPWDGGPDQRMLQPD